MKFGANATRIVPNDRGGRIMLNPEASWGDAVITIMYGAIFSPTLMPQVERLMGNLPGDKPRQVWITAIESALASNHSLASDEWPQHSDADVRQLLAEIARRLAAGKPYSLPTITPS